MKMTRTLQVAAPLAALIVATAHGQVGRGTTEWLTAGGDAQRTYWVRADPKISVASMSKPGFERQWSVKLDNRVRGVNGLTHGVSANGVTLFIPMSIVAGSSNSIYALDNDTGYVVWQRKFDAALPAATPQCPGGITAGATRIVPLTPPAITAAIAGITGGGRANQGYRSVIGEPGAGAPVETRGGGAGRAGAPAAGAPAAAGAGAAGAPGGRGAQGATAPPAGAPAGSGAAAPAAGGGGAPGAAPAAPQRGGGGGGGGFGGGGGATIPGATPEQLGGGGGLARASGVVYAISSDGILHVLGLPSGKDMQKPAEFIPANAKFTDTIAVNTTLYATTAGGCGNAPNAVWAIDLESESKPVVSWKGDSAVVGRLAFASDGTVVAVTAKSVVSLDPKTLAVKSTFTQAGAEFVTGPAVFKQGDRDVVAAATKDGRLLLLNAASLGGSPLGASAPGSVTVAGDALAAWQELTVTAAPAPAAADPAAGGRGGGGQPPVVTYGQQWILAPTSTGVAAFKVADAGGSLSLEKGWTAQGLAAPATPIVVNGVVFALSTGRPAAPAILKAFEGTTGKLLWDSKTTMKAPASPGSFYSALSQVYVGTNDGTLHAFGFLDERR